MLNLGGINLDILYSTSNSNNSEVEQEPLNLQGVDLGIIGDDSKVKTPKRDKQSRRETNPISTDVKTSEGKTNEVEDNDELNLSNINTSTLLDNKETYEILTDYPDDDIIKIDTNLDDEDLITSTAINDGNVSPTDNPKKDEYADINKERKIAEDKYLITPQQLGTSLFIPEGKALKLILPINEDDKKLSDEDLQKQLFTRGLSNVIDIMSSGMVSGEDRDRILANVQTLASTNKDFRIYKPGTYEPITEESITKMRNDGYMNFFFENRDYLNIIRDGIFEAKENFYKKNPGFKEAEVEAIQFEKDYGYDNFDSLNEKFTDKVRRNAWDIKRGLYKGLIQTKALAYRTGAALANTLSDETSIFSPTNIFVPGSGILLSTIQYVNPDYFNSNIKPYLPSSHYNFGVQDYFKAKENAVNYLLSNLENKSFTEKFASSLTTAGLGVLPIIGLSIATKNPALAFGLWEALQGSADKKGGFNQLINFAKGYAFGSIIGKTSQFGKLGSTLLQTGIGIGQEAITQNIVHGKIIDSDQVLISGLTQGILDLALSGQHKNDPHISPIPKYDFTKPNIETPIEKGLPLELQGTTIFNEVEANKIQGKAGLSQQYEGVVRLNILDARKQLDFLVSELPNAKGKNKQLIEKAIDDLSKGLEIQINKQYLRNTMNPARQLTGKNYSKEDIDNLVFLHDSIAEAKFRNIDLAISKGDINKARELQIEANENALLAELYSRPYDTQYLEANEGAATNLLDKDLTVDVITNRPNEVGYNDKGKAYKYTDVPKALSPNELNNLPKEVVDNIIENPDKTQFNLFGTIADIGKEAYEGKYVETGKDNKLTNQGTANIIREGLLKPPTGLRASTFGIDLLAKKASELSYLAAFHIEDFYRRGIEPTLDHFIRRLGGDFGVDFLTHFEPDDLKVIYNNGLDYYNSNNADPFYSKMKQEVIEKLPNKFNKQQALAVLKQEQFKTELAWTDGVEDWINNQEGKIDKGELIRRIQENQVRVEEVEKGKTLSEQEKNRLHNYSVRQLDGEELTEKELEDYNKLRAIEFDNSGKTKYDLDTYTSEKLELEGGVKGSSREMLLISPIRKVGSIEQHDIIQDKIEAGTATPEEVKFADLIREQNNNIYKSPHWDEDNILAHIRIKEYTKSDGKKIAVVNEIQSDWNQAGFKEGYKPNTNKPFEVYTSKSENVIAKFETEQEAKDFIKKDKEDLGYERLDYIDIRTEGSGREVPQNPFMGKNWKELSIKRVIRWAAENGYDEIGWTTSKQQQIKYNKIIETKSIDFSSNENGTYDITLKDNEGNRTTERNLTPKQIEEYTTKDIADKIISNAEYSEEGEGTIHGLDLKKGKGFEEYDTTYKNIFNKIARRFGSEYKAQDISTGITEDKQVYYSTKAEEIKELEAGTSLFYINPETSRQEIVNNKGQLNYINDELEARVYSYKNINNKEQIHTLSITPSLKQSALKEGFPIYGTSTLDPLKSNQPIGVRNVITDNLRYIESKSTISSLLEQAKLNNPEVTNELANSIVVNKSRLNTELSPNDYNNNGENLTDLLDIDNNGVVFNSGLNPQSFIEQAKLLYKGSKELGKFVENLSSIFGEGVRNKAPKIYEQLKRFNDDERGFTGIFSNPLNNPPEFNNFIGTEAKSISGMSARNLARMVFLSQWNPQIRDAISTTNKVRSYLNGKSSQILAQIHASNEYLKNNNEGKNKIAEVIYNGNEKGIRYIDINHIKNDLGIDISNNEFEAYKSLRNAQDLTLGIREEQKLIPLFRNLTELSNKGKANSKEYKDVVNKIGEVRSYYQKLKDSGYISLQRRGKYAISAIDPTKAIGSQERLIYTHAKNYRQVKDIINTFKKQGFEDINASNKTFDFYSMKNKLTPAQFERMVNDSGADPFSPEIETLRKEIRSKFSTSSYEIKRNFIRGYEISYDNAIGTISHQAEVYRNNYYSDIGRSYGMEGINNAGVDKFTVLKTDPNLLNGHPDKTTLHVFDDLLDTFDKNNNLVKGANSSIKDFQSNGFETKLINPDNRLKNFLTNYIDYETSPYSHKPIDVLSSKLRSFTYFMQLGFDTSQYFLNSMYQQVVMANSYFGRNGLSDLSLQPEKYFTRAIGLTTKILRNKTNNPEIDSLYKRANDEGFVQPQFTKSLVLNETGENTFFGSEKLGKVVEKSSYFMQKGEKHGRTHTFAEAYLVGKEVLKLKDDQLYNYITDAIDNVNQRFTKAENPAIFRSQLGKLFYQFNSYTSAYFEQMALAMRHDFSNNHKIPANTLRMLAPVILAGGLSGMPFYKGFRQLYTLLYDFIPSKIQPNDDDWQEALARNLENKGGTIAKNLVLYGFSTKKGVSNKLGINVPLFDNSFDFISATTDALGITHKVSFDKDTALKIPAIQTVVDTSKGLFNTTLGIKQYKDEGDSNRLRKGLEGLSLRAIRGISKAERYSREGITDINGEVILDPSELSTSDKLLQGMFNITPQPNLDYYDEKDMERIRKVREKLLEKFGQ